MDLLYNYIHKQTVSCLRLHICMFLYRPGVVSLSFSITSSLSVPIPVPVPVSVSFSVPVPVTAAVVGRGFHWSLEHQLVLLSFSCNLATTQRKKQCAKSTKNTAQSRTKKPKQNKKTCMRPAGWECTSIPVLICLYMKL